MSRFILENSANSHTFNAFLDTTLEQKMDKSDRKNPEMESSHRQYPGEITSEKIQALGLHCRLSDDAKQRIAAFESHMRAAEHKSGSILVG